jgi:hypothetical protein
VTRFTERGLGTTLLEVAMERIRIRKPVKPRQRPKILPLDPRDPDIVRAKTVRDRAGATRGRAA